ncbi:MAG TPA: DUF2306 domain-containing protein [Rhizomicrobium sp.]|jgi:uncharacterized membrane protein|nr:DUF2306 domain-containing protein [Rhizomicrobium sp.]
MMSLAPLLAAPFAVQLHVFTVVPAFFLGAWLIFFSRKGARRHRAIGYAYLGLMTVTAIAALFIHQIPSIDIVFGFGPIHLFSLLTLSGVVGALRGAWGHDVRMHRSAMPGVYIGGILIAGTFAFLPGRIMHAMLFG